MPSTQTKPASLSRLDVSAPSAYAPDNPIYSRPFLKSSAFSSAFSAALRVSAALALVAALAHAQAPPYLNPDLPPETRAADPAVVLEKIVINTGGLQPSYLGPPENVH